MLRLGADQNEYLGARLDSFVFLGELASPRLAPTVSWSQGCRNQLIHPRIYTQFLTWNHAIFMVVY